MLRFVLLNGMLLAHSAKNRLLYASTNRIGSNDPSPLQNLIAYVDTAKMFCSVPEEVPVLALKLQELDKDKEAALQKQEMKYEKKLRNSEAFYQKSLSFLTQRSQNI